MGLEMLFNQVSKLRYFPDKIRMNPIKMSGSLESYVLGFSYASRSV